MTLSKETLRRMEDGTIYKDPMGTMVVKRGSFTGQIPNYGSSHAIAYFEDGVCVGVYSPATYDPYTGKKLQAIYGRVPQDVIDAEKDAPELVQHLPAVVRREDGTVSVAGYDPGAAGAWHDAEPEEVLSEQEFIFKVFHDLGSGELRQGKHPWWPADHKSPFTYAEYVAWFTPTLPGPSESPALAALIAAAVEYAKTAQEKPKAEGVPR